jgi:hypothetical protein
MAPSILLILFGFGEILARRFQYLAVGLGVIHVGSIGILFGNGAGKE